jgi:hypothetical protein
MIGLFIYCLLDPTFLCAILSAWSLVFIELLVRAKIEVSSLAPNTSLNLVNFGSLSDYRRIDNPRSDVSVWTKLISFTFDRIVVSFSCSAYFFTDVTGLVMCSI